MWLNMAMGLDWFGSLIALLMLNSRDSRVPCIIFRVSRLQTSTPARNKPPHAQTWYRISCRQKVCWSIRAQIAEEESREILQSTESATIAMLLSEDTDAALM